MSVTTFATTSTDRERLANELVNLSPGLCRYDERELPAFSESEIERRLPQRIAIRPQVRPPLSAPLTPTQIDKRWKSRLQTSVPTEECLALVTPQDPLVHLTLFTDTLPPPRATAHSSESLPLVSASCSSLSPSFSVEVNVHSLFGEMSAARAWEGLRPAHQTRDRAPSSRGRQWNGRGGEERPPYVDAIMHGEAAFEFV
jgi:hypothetical protein